MSVWVTPKAKTYLEEEISEFSREHLVCSLEDLDQLKSYIKEYGEPSIFWCCYSEGDENAIEDFKSSATSSHVAFFIDSSPEEEVTLYPGVYRTYSHRDAKFQFHLINESSKRNYSKNLFLRNLENRSRLLDKDLESLGKYNISAFLTDRISLRESIETLGETTEHLKFINQILAELPPCRNNRDIEKVIEKYKDTFGWLESAEIVEVSPSEKTWSEEGFDYHLALPIQHGKNFYGTLLLKRDIESSPTDWIKPNDSSHPPTTELLMALVEAIALTIDRNRTLEKVSRTSDLWINTFLSIKAPVAITKNKVIIQANESASQIFKNNDPAEILSRINSQEVIEPFIYEWIGTDQKTYRVTCYPVDPSSESWVVSLKEITQERLYQDRLIETEKLAELGIIAGSIAHEINNPLGGILAYTQLLLESVPKEKEYESILSDLKEIETATLRCKKIVAETLGFSRQHDPFVREICDLKGVVDFAVGMIALRARHEGIHLDVDVSSERRMVEINRILITQVLLNILRKSLEAINYAESRRSYSKEGNEEIRPLLKLELIENPNKKNQVLLRIEDNGIHLSHKFSEIDAKIIEEHGGSFDVEAPDAETGLRSMISLPIVGECE